MATKLHPTPVTSQSITGNRCVDVEKKNYSDVGVGKGNKASRIRKSTWQCPANLPEPTTDLDMF